MNKKLCKHCPNEIEEHQENCFICNLLFGRNINSSRENNKKSVRIANSILGNYLWAIGIGLLVAWASKIIISPVTLFQGAVIFLFLGAILKSIMKSI